MWRREGWSVRDMVRWADGDVLTLLTLAKWLRRDATRYIDRAQSRLRRPLYYAREKARREALAAERRRVGGRRTTSPCPTREAVLDAWIHRRESHGAAVRFGSMIHDLECYVDNSLLRDESGAIVGRRGGVKAWLQENGDGPRGPRPGRRRAGGADAWKRMRMRRGRRTRLRFV